MTIRRTMYVRFVKPLFDRFFAAISLLVLSPLIAMLLLINAIYWRSNPLFTQRRPGKLERQFTIYKLRTMLNDSVSKLDQDRLTKWGMFLRLTSMDELPQLINVLKGEMSFVGPRPLLIEYIPLYTPKQRERHSVLPGITGLAQISGGNALSWETKLELDVRYTKQISILLDLKILLLTIRRFVFKRRDDGFFSLNKNQNNQS